MQSIGSGVVGNWIRKTRQPRSLQFEAHYLVVFIRRASRVLRHGTVIGGLLWLLVVSVSD